MRYSVVQAKRSAQAAEDPVVLFLQGVDAIAASSPNDRCLALVATLREALASFVTTRETIDVGVAVENVISVVRGEAKTTTTITLTVPDEPVTIFADYTRLALAILQLAMNAVAAANECPNGHVRITLHRGRAGGVYLEIGDNGLGMNRAMVTRAFRPFFTTRTDERAAGIGLPLSRALLRSLGGSIDLETAPNVGTVAMVVLPGSTDVYASGIHPQKR